MPDPIQSSLLLIRASDHYYVPNYTSFPTFKHDRVEALFAHQCEPVYRHLFHGILSQKGLISIGQKDGGERLYGIAANPVLIFCCYVIDEFSWRGSVSTERQLARRHCIKDVQAFRLGSRHGRSLRQADRAAEECP